MRRRLVAVLSALLLLLCCVSLPVLGWRGCNPPPKDVTSDPSFGRFAPVIGTWKTKVPLRLVEINRSPHVGLYLVWGDAFIAGSKDLAVLPIGTEITIERLIHRKTFETEFLDVMGCLTSGPYAGKKLAIDERLFAEGTVFTATIWHGDPRATGMTWSVAPDKLTK